jgi:hypothetical protein
MKLIELYLDEIKHHLPPRNRDDILKEIRSNLMDMIEDQNPDPENEPNQALVRDILNQFGAPRDVALQYGAKNYLIGPRFFPIYLQVLKIVLIVVAAVSVLGLTVALISQTEMTSGVIETIIETIVEMVGGTFNSLFTAFGIVTLVFAGIERTTSEDIKIKPEKTWSVDDLIEKALVERVKIAELTFEITLTIIFLVVLNFFQDKIGIYYLTETGWVGAPILNENIQSYLPWISAFQILSIGLNLYLIRTGFWDKFAAIAKIAINVLQIALLAAMIAGPAILTVSPTAWRALNFDLGVTASEMTSKLNFGMDIVWGLAIFGLVVESIKRLYTRFIKGTTPQIEIEKEKKK